MPHVKLAISMEPELVRQVDGLVQAGRFASRSAAIADAVARQLASTRASRLADACALEDSVEARALAQERHVADAFGSEPW